MQQITLLQVAKKKGVQLTRQQLFTVAHQAGRIYKNLTGEKPEKIPQDEDGQLFQVNCYPEEFEVILNNLIDAQYATVH